VLFDGVCHERMSQLEQRGFAAAHEQRALTTDFPRQAVGPVDPAARIARLRAELGQNPFKILPCYARNPRVDD